MSIEEKRGDNCFSKEILLSDLTKYWTTCSDDEYNSYNPRLDLDLNSSCLDEAEEKKAMLDDYREKCDQEDPSLRFTEEEKLNVKKTLETYDISHVLSLSEDKKDNLIKKFKKLHEVQDMETMRERSKRERSTRERSTRERSTRERIRG